MDILILALVVCTACFGCGCWAGYGIGKAKKPKEVWDIKAKDIVNRMRKGEHYTQTFTMIRDGDWAEKV